MDEPLHRVRMALTGGGIPEALLRLNVADLPQVTGGTFADVCQG